jgi:PIN domain nuclease of toxin-antitoxin system
MSESVLDASALLALLGSEPGGDKVVQALSRGVAMSAVNLAEVVAKLADSGMPDEAIHATLDPLGLTLIDFDRDVAFQTGLLRPATRSAGLSLGDRACLALAQHLSLPALTADRNWANLSLGIPVTLIH